MKKTAYVVLLMLSSAGAFLTGSFHRERSGLPPSHEQTRTGTAYTCAMHPAYTSDRPGTCPMCGMALVSTAAPTEAAIRQVDALVGQIRVSTERQQVGGVRMAEVAVSPGGRTLRLPGRVATDETRTYTVNAGIDGFVRDVSPVTTGTFVRKGQPLASFSAPEAIPSLQAYIVAMNAMDHLRQAGGEGAAQAQIGSTSSNFQQRLEKLQDLGMSLAQVEELARTRAVPAGIRIVAPADGYLLSRTISIGQRFSRGTEWFRIADLRRVWVVADVLGPDAERITAGLRATVSIPSQHRTLDGSITQILPQYDPVTRTLQVRLEVDNRGFALRPDMAVDVNLVIDGPPMVTVPREALIDTGLRKVVYVERERGIFEAREVGTGWQSADLVEVVAGLVPGERIAVSGAFLLDSESRMTAGQPGASSHRDPTALAEARSGVVTVDPVCGMDVASDRFGAEHRGHTYRFCSLECKRQFDKEPGRYVSGALPRANVQARAGGRP